ncbi:MAG: repressor LexA [Anaerophaga sp.]|nr:repressor LexA [Anaerophaga sp.]
MANVGEKIKARRLELGLTLNDIGKACGVSKSTAMKWENGEIENMKRDKIVLLAKALRVDPSYVLGMEDEIKPRTSKGIKIPVLGRVAAGIPIEAIEDILDYEEITEDMDSSPGAFSCRNYSIK